MKRAPALIPALLLSCFAPASAQNPESLDLAIVVHADNPVREVSSRELRNIFMKRLTQWEAWSEDGESVEILPVDQTHTLRVRKTFSDDVLDSSASRIRSYWQRQVFSGQGVPPEVLSSDEEVLDFIRSNLGAIGYVSASTPLWEGVRPLVVSDLETSGDVRQASHDASRSLADEVADRRGEVRILLSGSCGPKGEGRTALLQHRDRYGYVQVAVETSRWRDGLRQASNRQTHTLNGDEEVRLGCTRAGTAEMHYALVDSSDNSVYVDPGRAHRAPSRDFIVLTESGTCGRGGLGRFVSAVNQHPERSIYVILESVRRLDRRLQNRSMSSFRLEPGGEKELGCSLDGALEKQYSVMEAK